MDWVATLNVTNILVNLIPNGILYKIGKCKDANELWCKLVKLHEDPTSMQNEDGSKERDSLDKEEEDSERNSTSKEEIEEVSTSRMEGEYVSLTS